MRESKVSLACEATAIIGEGPLWVVREQRLYWLDLDAATIWRLDPATGRNERVDAQLDGYVGGMVERASGGFVVVDRRGAFHLDPGSGALARLGKLAATSDTVFNDAKCDRTGNLWTGTKHVGETDGVGSLFRLRKDLSIDTIDTGLVCANGPAFSPDGRSAYFTDSPSYAVYRYAIDTRSEAVGPREIFARTTKEEGEPDGMTVDAEGCLWVALWGGWRVRRYTPDGKVERDVMLPVPQPTAPQFGGPDMSTMFVTTARRGLEGAALAAAPLSGSVFAVETGVRGLVESRYIG
jgi:sugar lactone lactonase YvrE